jgi:hypothetical protein
VLLADTACRLHDAFVEPFHAVRRLQVEICIADSYGLCGFVWRSGANFGGSAEGGKRKESEHRQRTPPGRGRTRVSRRSLRFPQLQRAILTTDLDRLAADPHLNGVAIELAVASRTSSFHHDRSPLKCLSFRRGQ